MPECRGLNWGSLPGISALQRLVVLRLEDVTTAPLEPGVGALNSLADLRVICRQMTPLVRHPWCRSRCRMTSRG